MTHPTEAGEREPKRVGPARERALTIAERVADEYGRQTDNPLDLTVLVEALSKAGLLRTEPGGEDIGDAEFRLSQVIDMVLDGYHDEATLSELRRLRDKLSDAVSRPTTPVEPDRERILRALGNMIYAAEDPSAFWNEEDPSPRERINDAIAVTQELESTSA